MNYDEIYSRYLVQDCYGEWDWFYNFKETDGYEVVYGLTEKGDDLFLEWKDDASVGYNLGNGHAYGLADRYTFEEIVNRIINDDELSVKIKDYE